MNPDSLIICTIIAGSGFTVQLIVSSLIILCLLFISALMSGSEVAFFSLSPATIQKMKKKKNSKSEAAIRLLQHPEKLLATLLVTNTFVNIGIVIISTWLTTEIFTFNDPVTALFFQGIIVTLVILIFGEILPKAYATQFNSGMVAFMALPLTILQKFMSPFTFILLKSSGLVKRKLSKKGGVTINDLSHAIDLASDDLQEEEQILKGIVKFGNIDVKEIMRARMDVITVEIRQPFSHVMGVIRESGYSRIPVINQNFDQVKGILYIKDLLPHLHKTDFRWQSLMRPPYFIPESKKIDDLLEEFQEKKIHMAVVIDEYGGASGIVTLEDVIEEIVGEINDEYDEDDKAYIRLEDGQYLFEGKILLNDFYRAVGSGQDVFDEIKGDSDTLAGLLLEVKGAIPAKEEVISLDKFDFRIKSVDNRRIKQILVKVKTIDQTNLTAES